MLLALIIKLRVNIHAGMQNSNDLYDTIIKYVNQQMFCMRVNSYLRFILWPCAIY